MLIGEAVQRIQSAYSKGMQSDDSRLSNRHIYSKLRSSRIRILSQQLSKKQVVNQWCYQRIKVLFSSVTLNESSEINSKTCTVLKSTLPLPQIFTNLDKHLIQSVTTSDGSYGFSQTYWEQVRYNTSRKYTSKLSEFYIWNGYLYITNKTQMPFVYLTALFNDPIEATKYNAPDPCLSYLSYDFAVDGKIEEAIIELSTNELLNFANSIDDQRNNSMDDITTMKRERPSNQSKDNNE